MGLPAGRFHEFLQRGSLGLAQHGQHFGGFGVLAGWSGFLEALGRPLPGLPLLALWADLALRSATWARRCATGPFWWVSAVRRGRRGWGGVGFFCIPGCHVFSLSGDYRGHDMDHSGAPVKQVNSV